MTKKIQLTDIDISVEERNVAVVTIGKIRFEADEMFPWVDVYLESDECRTLIHQEHEYEDIFTWAGLRRFAINWCFNNVEIVEEFKED